MLNSIELFDRQLLFAINHAHNPVLDEIMWVISGKILWIALIFLLLGIVLKRAGLRKTLIILIGCLICILLADTISVHLFKNTFERLRPSHNMEINKLLHYYTYADGNIYKGGLFGFVSSHAANFFAIATWLYLSLRTFNKHIFWIAFSCATLIGYSRIYLGVHYPSDVIVGALLGVLIGFFVHKLNVTFVEYDSKSSV